jgi:serine/threonine-protein kinase RsbW
MSTPTSQQIFAPEHHKEMITRIYHHLGADHRFITPEATILVPEKGESVIQTGENKLEGCAEIFISAYGANAVKEVRMLLRHYCVENYPTINLYLRLSDPLTWRMTEEFENLGFFFAGVIPEFRFGETLALQYLNNVELDYSKIILVSEMAKELMGYIRDHDSNIID